MREAPHAFEDGSTQLSRVDLARAGLSSDQLDVPVPSLLPRLLQLNLLRLLFQILQLLYEIINMIIHQLNSLRGLRENIDFMPLGL